MDIVDQIARMQAGRARKLAEGGKIERFDPVEKAKRNPKSLRLAIIAKCVECMGGADSVNWRREIRDCTAPLCPLWPVRPYQRSATVSVGDD